MGQGWINIQTARVVHRDNQAPAILAKDPVHPSFNKNSI
jgi:hypothetical protein